jgi:hypothetical protein
MKECGMTERWATDEGPAPADCDTCGHDWQYVDCDYCGSSECYSVCEGCGEEERECEDLG